MFIDLEVFHSGVYTVRSATLPEELDEKNQHSIMCRWSFRAGLDLYPPRKATKNRAAVAFTVSQGTGAREAWERCAGKSKWDQSWW